ncbi:MAG: YitT family protein [Clostridiales bacterium]|nr:YitT family protein [Clostridiales bacterium]
MKEKKEEKEKKKIFTKKAVKEFMVDFAILLIACSVSAFSVVGVLLPNGLTSGGITGVVRIVQNYVDIDFSFLFYGGSLVVVVLVAIFMGWKELKKILLLSIMYPAVLFVFERFDFQLLEEKDILLAAVFCGVFTGIYVGLVFWRGYASAGTDAIAKLLRKKFFHNVSLSKILMCIDAVIILSSAVVYGRNIALYALITQVIITKTSEVILYGFENKVMKITIITSEYEKMRDYIINDLGRGVSSTEIQGEYTHKTMRQLILLCSPRESTMVKKKIAEIDRGAFVTLIRVETVWGAGKDFDDIVKE